MYLKVRFYMIKKTVYVLCFKEEKRGVYQTRKEADDHACKIYDHYGQEALVGGFLCNKEEAEDILEDNISDCDWKVWGLI